MLAGSKSAIDHNVYTPLISRYNAITYRLITSAAIDPIDFIFGGYHEKKHQT